MIEHRDLKYWGSLINQYDKNVSKALLNKNERVEISESLLDGLRHFVEAVMCYIREFYEPKEFPKRYVEIEESKKYCKSRSNLKFIADFDENLNGSIGHQDFFGEYAERLFIKYYSALIKVKELLKNSFSIDVLNELSLYPLDLDESFIAYYRLIIKTISKNDLNDNLFGCDSYYVQKKKMLYVDGIIFYEYTLSVAIDRNNRFDRFIAFSLLDIPSNYAFKARLVEKNIIFFNQSIDYQIIVGFNVAIRPCELEKLSNIMGLNYSFQRSKEYWNLMNYIGKWRIPLNRIAELSDEEYESFSKSVFLNTRETLLYKLLSRCRSYLKSDVKIGKNTLRYLMYKMNNVIMRCQLPKNEDDSFYQINLSKGTYGFDKLPFSTCPLNHIPHIKDLLQIFNVSEHKEELLERTIDNYSKLEACIYISEDKIGINDIDNVISSYNSNFNKTSLEKRKVYRTGKYIYLNENELNTKNVLVNLISKSSVINFPNYNNFINNQIISKRFEFDDPDKESALRKMYTDSSVFAVYGAAGSGKSYFANYVLHSMDDVVKVCIASTNPAVDNMRRRFDDNTAYYMTINKYLKEYKSESCIDLLVIDECSAVSSQDMSNILTKTNPKLLLLLGDTYQIKSISFGNWFSLLRRFLKKESYVDLNNQYRCHSETLLPFWNEVRTLGKNIQELLSVNEISRRFDKTIFDKYDLDEIILCLNYDGLYGINNLNKVLQKNNPNKEFKWKQHIFKIDDPIIFDDTSIYNGVFYNNLKGVILDIEEKPDKFIFKVQIKRVVNPLLCSTCNVKFFEIKNNESIVSFEVKKYGEDYYDNDTGESTIFPFQIAYALSIHKAQGLEYNSVKIIISNEVEEQITHNIFYTAITRAKRILNIYWTPESENKIVNSFYIDNCDNDAVILSSKYSELKLQNN